MTFTDSIIRALKTKSQQFGLVNLSDSPWRVAYSHLSFFFRSQKNFINLIYSLCSLPLSPYLSSSLSLPPFPTLSLSLFTHTHIHKHTHSLTHTISNFFLSPSLNFNTFFLYLTLYLSRTFLVFFFHLSVCNTYSPSFSLIWYESWN